jgi:glycosyltransferase involved in cell wall biosynthesis
MAPLISLLLPVKNAWPHVKATIEALHHQTYRHYEVIVQDGGSTDGTLDYLGSLADMPNLTIASEPDRGIGQAYNRALTRSSGELVCFIAADEYLEPDSLERGIAWFHQYPDAVIVNGAVRLTNAAGEAIQLFEAPAFDLLGHLRCDVVLPFAGLLNRRRIGADLFYDESLETCPDYEFWIRVGSRVDAADFVSMRDVFKTARADRTSMSFRADSFDRFCRDKLYVLERYLGSRPRGVEVESIRRSATAGIYLWAAESVFFLEGASEAFLKWCEAAARVEPSAAKLLRLARRSGAFAIAAGTRTFWAAVAIPPGEPPAGAWVVAGGVTLDRVHAHAHWIGASVEEGPVPRIHAPEGPWEYAAEIPLALTGEFDDRCWYWVALDIEVRAGQVGVALMVGSDIAHEQIVSSADGRKTIFLAVATGRAAGIVIRNGGLRQRSTADVFSASILGCPMAPPTDLAAPSPASRG